MAEKTLFFFLLKWEVDDTSVDNYCLQHQQNGVETFTAKVNDSFSHKLHFGFLLQRNA